MDGISVATVVGLQVVNLYKSIRNGGDISTLTHSHAVVKEQVAEVAAAQKSILAAVVPLHTAGAADVPTLPPLS